MNKIKILAVLILIPLFFTPILIQGDYQVTIGQTFTYSVNKSYWRVKLGSNSGSASCFYFFPESRDIGTDVIIEVTDVIPSRVDFNYTVGSTIIPFYCDSFNTELDLTMTLLYFNILGIMFNNPWNQQLVDDGPTLHTTLFLNVEEDTFDFFRKHSNSTYLNESITYPAYQNANFKGNFDESGTIAIFDWMVEGNINNPFTSDPFNIDGYYMYKMAFNKNTGVEQGYRLELDFSGTCGGENFEIFLEQEVTLEGYSIPDFYFDKPVGLPGFKWYTLVCAFCILIIPIVKNKNNKQN